MFHLWPRREIEILIPYDAHVEEESLVISGHVFDEVGSISGLLEHDVNMYQEVAWCALVMDLDPPNVYGGNDAKFEYFWRTVVADYPKVVNSIANPEPTF